MFENIKISQILQALLSFPVQFVFAEHQHSLAVTLPEMDIASMTFGLDFDAKKDLSLLACSRNSCVTTRRGKRCVLPLPKP